MITLDLLGCLNNFKNRFDLNKYNLFKDSIFINVLANYKNDYFLKEIYDLIIETDYSIPIKYKMSVIILNLRSKIAGIKIIRKIYHIIFKNK